METHFTRTTLTVIGEDGKTIIIQAIDIHRITEEDRMLRSEYSANLSLIPLAKRPTWMEPAPIRTKPSLWTRILRALHLK
jgi:hypothetical protein